MRMAVLFVLAVFPLSAQFWSELANPKVEVVLTHPPGLGLKIDRVAFIPGRDFNSRELADQLTAGVVESRAIEVVDRSHLDIVLKEQELGQSGYIDPSTIASLGKLLGPTAVVIVNVNRSEFSKNQATKEERFKDNKGVEQVRTQRRSILVLDFSASVQVVDLGTGKIFGAQRIEENPSAFSSSYDGWPAYPREGDVRRAALESARGKVMRLLLPWTETRKLTFFNDKEFQMNLAYDRLELRDYQGAMDLAKRGLELSKNDTTRKPKYYPRTYYNLGIMHFILGNYDEARPFLQQALDMQPDASIFRTAYRECLDALDLQAALRKSEARSAAMAKPPSTPPPTIAPPANGKASPEDRLRKLQELYKKGLLEKSEYEAKKAEILKEI